MILFVLVVKNTVERQGVRTPRPPHPKNQDKQTLCEGKLQQRHDARPAATAAAVSVSFAVCATNPKKSGLLLPQPTIGDDVGEPFPGR